MEALLHDQLINKTGPTHICSSRQRHTLTFYTASKSRRANDLPASVGVGFGGGCLEALKFIWLPGSVSAIFVVAHQKGSHPPSPVSGRFLVWAPRSASTIQTYSTHVHSWVFHLIFSLLASYSKVSWIILMRPTNLGTTPSSHHIGDIILGYFFTSFFSILSNRLLGTLPTLQLIVAGGEGSWHSLLAQKQITVK